MLRMHVVLQEIEEHIKQVIAEDSPQGVALWNKLLHLPPADIAHLIESLSEKQQLALFDKLPRALAILVFEELGAKLQALFLPTIDLDDVSLFFKKMPTDTLTDLFDELSDEDLKKYLN